MIVLAMISLSILIWCNGCSVGGHGASTVDPDGTETPTWAPPEGTEPPLSPPYKLSDMIKWRKDYKVDFKLAVYSAMYSGYSVAQGACTDGTYVYFILRTPENGDGVITKYELSTGKLVMRSKPIYVFHGNDMTYDTIRNIIYVVHGSSEGKILTTVDPETLEVIDQTVNIAKGAGAITYSSTRDRFAISQGGKSLHILDSSLNVLKSVTREELGYTAQGMGSDEDFIYFPMSPKGDNMDNILVVYDWDANYVTTIHLDTDRESESLFYLDGVYYINFNMGDGARLFRMNITLQ